MKNNIAKCGCDCLNCPTYKENIKTIDDRRKCSSAWEKYIKIKLSPEKLRACDGCSVTDSERKTYYLNCKIRKCAIINEIENCAYCSGFPCKELGKAHSLQKIRSREEFIQKTGKGVTNEDYKRFIEPYAGLNRLEIIQHALNPKEIKDFKKYAVKTTNPVKNNLIERKENLNKVLTILSTLYVETDISYARLQTLEKKREQILKIIWTMGYFGQFQDDKKYLELDANTYSSQKINGMYNALLDYFKELIKHDIHCEIVPLTEKGWLTPMGGLRKQGWVMRLSFGKSLNGHKTLKDFKEYILILSEKYGNKVFRIFSAS